MTSKSLLTSSLEAASGATETVVCATDMEAISRNVGRSDFNLMESSSLENAIRLVIFSQGVVDFISQKAPESALRDPCLNIRRHQRVWHGGSRGVSRCGPG